MVIWQVKEGVRGTGVRLTFHNTCHLAGITSVIFDKQVFAESRQLVLLLSELALSLLSHVELRGSDICTCAQKVLM